MRRRTLTTALALALPTAVFGTPALAKSPSGSGTPAAPAAANWSADRTRALRAALPDLRGRRTAAGARVAAQLDEERRVDAIGLGRAIDGSQYSCAPTELSAYVRQ